VVEEFVLSAQSADGSYNGEQFADYVLLGGDGKPLAVVEAKDSQATPPSPSAGEPLTRGLA